VFHIAVYFLLLAFYTPLGASSQAEVTDKQMMVTMRMIGDEVLKSMGDKTSKVSVSEVLDGYYKIGFESEFAILPDSLVKKKQ